MGFLRVVKTPLVLKKVAQSTGFLFFALVIFYTLFNINLVQAKDINLGTSGDRILINGNIGVGITNPLSSLHFYGTTATTTEYLKFTSADGGDIRFGKASGFTNDAIIGTWTNNNLLFFTNTGERMRLDPLGNLGIGTTSPVQKLDVEAGNINLDQGQTLMWGNNGGRSITMDDSASHNALFSVYGNMSFQTYDTSSYSSKLTILKGGNVGIGATNPNNMLTIDKNTAGTPSSYMLRLANSGGTNTPEAMFQIENEVVHGLGLHGRSGAGNIDKLIQFWNLNTGNVGIGTTSAGATFDIGGTIGSFRAKSGTLSNIGGGIIMADASGNLYSTSSLAAITAGWTVNGTEVYKTNTTGNVGIGVTNPASKLAVVGQNVSFLSETANNTLVFGRNALENLSIFHDDANVILESVQDENAPGYGNMIFRVDNDGTADGYFAFQNKTGTDFLRINSLGNIGIGTTSPFTKLQVLGGAAFGNGAQTSFLAGADFQIQKNGNNNTVLGMWQNGVASSLIGSKANDTNFYLTNNYYGAGIGVASTSISITSSGNVGIGITNPGTTLDVGGTIGSFRAKSGTLSNIGTGIIMADASGNLYSTSSLAAISAGWTVNGTSVYKTNVNGNVGIGTTTPTNLLHVAASVVPTVDMVNISNAGFPVATAGVSGLQIGYTGGAGAIEASAQRTDLTPGSTSGSTWNALRVTSGAAGAGVILNGIKLEDKTAGAGSSVGLRIGTGWDYGIYSNTAGINYFAGNVGIGTTNPTSKLDITGVYSEVSLNATSTAVANFRTSGHVQLAINTSVTSPYTTSLQAKHSVTNGSAYPLALNPLGGNVGVGTSNPGLTLDVNGSANVKNVLRAGNYRHVLSTGFSANGVNGYLLTTTIPYDGLTQRGMHTIRIQGFSYGTNQNIDFAVNFYLYTSGFSTYGWTNYGAYDPGTVKLSYEGNVLKLWWSNFVYYPSFEVFTDSWIGAVDTNSYFEGWTITDVAAPVTNVVDVPYKNASPKGLNMGGNLILNANWLSGDGGNEGLSVNTAGNVGIGITNPGTLLDVGGTGTFRAKSGTLSNIGAGLIMADASGNLYSTSSAVATGIPSPAGISGQTLRSNGTNWVANSLLYVNGTNVGIGATNPGSKLHILSLGGANTGINLQLSSASSYAPIDFNTPSGLSGQFLTTGSSFSNGFWGSDQVGFASRLINGAVAIGAIGSNGYIKFATGGEAATNERMRIDSTGNVGIGLTNPVQKFVVSGGSGYINSGNFYIDNGFGFISNDGKNGFYPDTASGLIFKASSTEFMRLNQAGNLGVGTTAPGTKTEIQRVETVNRTSYNDILTITANASTNPYSGHGGGILFSGTTYRSGTGNVNFARIGSTLNDHSVSTAGSDLFFDVSPLDDGVLSRAMTIKYSGNVGIGTTTVGATLDIQTSVASIRAKSATLSNIGSGVVMAQGTGDLYTVATSTFLNNSGWTLNGTTVYKTDVNGNVGIGTTTPSNILSVGARNPVTSTNRKAIEINAGGYGAPTAYNTNSNGDKLILYRDAVASYDGTIGVGSVQDMWFKSSGPGVNDGIFRWFTGSTPTERMTILGSGNVGIGTTTPNGLLHVAAKVAPTFDMVNISNAGFPVATAGVSGLQIGYTGGAGAVEASAQRTDLTPGSTSGSTWNALRVTSGAAAAGVILNGIKLEDKAAGAGTSVGLRIGTGWDYGIYSNTAGINYFAGNVGISNTNPDGKLHISGVAGSLPATTGTTPLGLLVRLEANGTNEVLDIGSVGGGAGSWLQGTNRISLNSVYPIFINPNGGNVGVGSTSTPGTTFDVGGTIGSLRAKSGTLSNIGSGIIMADASGNLYSTSSLAAITAGWTVNGTTVYKTDVNGNVGIGTTTPTQKFSVEGSSARARIDTLAGSSGGLEVQGSTAANNPYARFLLEGLSATPYLNIQAGDGLAYRSIILNSAGGNVGVGTSTNPIYGKLQITGSGTYSSGLTLYAGSGNLAASYLKSDGAADFNWFLTRGGGDTTGMVIKGNGYVGIGNTNPATILDVTGDINLNNQAVTAAGTVNRGYYVYKSGTTSYGLKLQYTSGEYGTMMFGPNQASRFLSFGKVGAALTDDSMVEYMRLDLDNGNLGIGTTNPGTTLDVASTTGSFRAKSATITNLTSGFVMGDASGNLYVTSSAASVIPAPSTAGATLRANGTNWLSNTLLYNNGTNIGIGTTSPSQLLTVGNNNQFTVSSSGTIAGVGPLLLSTNGLQNSLFSVYSNTSFYRPIIGFAHSRGTIGSGTTSQDGDMLGDFQWSGSYGNAITTWSSAGFGAIQVGATPDINSAAAALYFSTSAGGGTGATERMRIDKTGNVGIGVTNPGGKLHIVDTSGILLVTDQYGNNSSASTIRMRKVRGTTAVPAIVANGDYLNSFEGWGYDGAAFRRGTFVASVINGTPASSNLPTDLVFATNAGAVDAVENMRLTNGGNLGIGTTNPGATLDVRGTIASFRANSATLSNIGAGTILADVTGNLYSTTTPWTSNGTTVYSLNSGNVGIGTTNPITKFNVNGSVVFSGSTNASPVDGELVYDTGTHAYKYFNSSSWMSLSGGTINSTGGYWTQNGTLLYYTAGSVGINTRTPLGKFEVDSGTVGTVASDETPCKTGCTGLVAGSASDYNMGYKFTVNTNGQITALWANVGDTGSHTIRLYTSAGALLASATVTGSINTWVSAAITPVNVTAGNSYVVAVRINSGVYNHASMASATTNITMNEGRYDAATDAMPTTNSVTTIYGVADVTYTTGVTTGGTNVSAFLVDNSGNVGINTSTPAYKLDVNGAINATSILINGVAVGTGGSQWASGSGGIISYIGGNVGIGTTNPLLKFHLSSGLLGAPVTSGTVQTYGTMRLRGNDNGILDQGFLAGGGAWFQSADQSALGTNYSLLLNPNGGNVGIGTTNPLSKLNIVGATGLINSGATQFSMLNGAGTSYLRVDNSGTVSTALMSDVSSASKFAGGLIYHRTPVADAPYSATTTDYIIAYTSLSTNRVLTLPTGLCTEGRALLLVNEASSTSAVIVTPASPAKISGQSTINLYSYNSIPVYCNGTDWFIY